MLLIRLMAVSIPTMIPTPRELTCSQYLMPSCIEVARATPLVVVPRIPRERIAKGLFCIGANQSFKSV